MAEGKLQAGATLDLLNKRELREALDAASRDWFSQVARGDRYRRFSASGAISGSAVSIGGARQRDAVLGPAEGFVWAVQRLAVGGLETESGIEAVSLYINDSGAASLVHPAIEGYQAFGEHELVLYPGDVLLVEGASLASTGTVTVTGQAREVPLPLAWRLGG